MFDADAVAVVVTAADDDDHDELNNMCALIVTHAVLICSAGLLHFVLNLYSMMYLKAENAQREHIEYRGARR